MTQRGKIRNSYRILENEFGKISKIRKKINVF
jgi:hypothetical protein